MTQAKKQCVDLKKLTPERRNSPVAICRVNARLIRGFRSRIPLKIALRKGVC